MSANASTAKGRLGRGLTLLILAGLAVIGYLLLDRPGRPLVTPATPSAPMEPRREQSHIVPIASPSVAAIDRGVVVQAPPRATESGYRPPASPAEPSTSFKFLGKMTQGDQTVILLHRGGATLAVLDVGAVDDEYAVDALSDTYVVLREVSSGATQIIELAARAPVPAGEVWGGDSAQD